MKPDVKKIIADIKATKGNRKFCNGLAGTLQDDNYASSICKYVKTVTPERIDLLIEYAEKLEAEVTDMAVQLANAESKCRELAAEISRRDEIFIPVYPDNNLMNKMTDVFHDTAKIHCDEDCIFVDNAELVITSIINNYIKSDDAFLAEVRAQESKRVYESILDNTSVTDMESLVDWLEQNANDSASFAAQIRQGVQS
ncbi:hypothetical protein L2W95_20505 [Citrobacter freundii]|uniref:Uncharacterized protein n=1 Tax=Citrobacter freundii TaxID=546 RepID=A0ABY7KY47_CITFR|nr:hypothetical protein [Citrobacter freundii]MDE9635878.1 hypothetical protein [Citrobacter freundii]WAZ56374.1 hypothetical protein O4000_19040 [Citrobacter freundii]WBS46507.1 hypothetical protein PF691_19030 [Citrobacter freundii]